MCILLVYALEIFVLQNEHKGTYVRAFIYPIYNLVTCIHLVSNGFCSLYSSQFVSRKHVLQKSKVDSIVKEAKFSEAEDIACEAESR